MLRTKASTYAILAVVEIARRQGESPFGLQANAIAQQFRLPSAYVAKVLTLLVRARILRSDRGPRGGFQLAKLPAQVTFLDIVEAVDGPIVAMRDAGTPPVGTDTEVGIERIFFAAAEQVRSELAKQTIGEFLALRGRAAG
jgi:Rrf2 family protein